MVLVSGMYVGKTGGPKSEVDVMTRSHLPNIGCLTSPSEKHKTCMAGAGTDKHHNDAHSQVERSRGSN